MKSKPIYACPYAFRILITICIAAVMFAGCAETEDQSVFVFKNEKSRSAYRAVYRERLNTWSIPFISRYVESAYGKTHVIECGNPDAPSLVLLHGFSGTSTMWRDIAADLADEYHIFAIDIIADINLSEPSRKISASEDFAKWLHETVVVLGIQGCYAVGESYGGWQIMNCLYRYPDLFREAIIINPMPGLTDFTFGGNGKFVALALNPSRKNIAKFLREMVVHTELVEEGFIDLVYTGFQSGKTGIPSDGYILDDAQLAKIIAPVTYLIGDSDVFAKSGPRLARRKALHPSSRMVDIENAGHDMVTDAGPIVCDYARGMSR